MSVDQPVRYLDFERAASRLPIGPSLRRIAKLSIVRRRSAVRPGDSELPTATQHFALAGVAKAVISTGRSQERKVTDRQIAQLCGEFIGLEDPFFDEAGIDGAWDAYMIRMGYEQFPWQESQYASRSRTKLLFGKAASDTRQSVIDPGALSLMLGCSLDDFLGVVFLLQAAASNNGGHFDLSWIDQPSFRKVLDLLPATSIRKAVSKHFVQTVAEYRAAAANARLDDPRMRRYEFNPLLAKPFVKVHGVPIAPVPHLISSRASTAGMYFIGLEIFGKEFADALGPVFEKYIEMQLRSASPTHLRLSVPFRGLICSHPR